MAFSLKSLLILVAAIAVTLVGSQQLHRLYCLRELDRSIAEGDGCSALETLEYAKDQGFRDSWADDTWVSVAERGDFQALRYFSLATDINRKIDGDQTALMIVAANGHFNAAKFLLLEGADTTIQNAGGETAFDIATSVNHLEIATLISVSQSVSWDRVIVAERMVVVLKRVNSQTRTDIDELLSKKEFAELAAMRIETPQIGDITHWFRANEHINIGMTPSGYECSWMVDGIRIDEVELF